MKDLRKYSEELIKFAILFGEVGIWNEGVGSSSDAGVWISAVIKNGFVIGWLGDTGELKEVSKCWR